MIGVVFALKWELKGILSQVRSGGLASVRVPRILEADLENQKVLLLLTGTGKERSQEWTEYLVQRHSPQAILCLGFAGGAVNGLESGYLVLAQKLYQLQDRSAIDPLEVDSKLLGLALKVVEASGLPFRCGDLLTVPYLVRQSERKEEMGIEFPIIALDMESYWVGQIAYHHRLPFLAVRSIVDPVEEVLPSFVDGLPSERVIFKAILYAMGNPLRFWELKRWREAMQKANYSLERFLRLWLQSFVFNGV